MTESDVSSEEEESQNDYGQATKTEDILDGVPKAVYDQCMRSSRQQRRRKRRKRQRGDKHNKKIAAEVEVAPASAAELGLPGATAGAPANENRGQGVPTGL